MTPAPSTRVPGPPPTPLRTLILKSTLSSAFTTAGEPLSGTITVTILDPGIAWQVTTSNGGNYLIRLIGGVLKVTAPTSIQAIAAAASIAVAVGLLGGGVSGAGAVATNVILTKTDATIADSVISSADGRHARRDRHRAHPGQDHHGCGRCRRRRRPGSAPRSASRSPGTSSATGRTAPPRRPRSTPRSTARA